MKRQLPFIIAAIIATLFIFFNSLQPAGVSDANSDVIINFVMDTARDAGHSLHRLYVGKTVRKIAHILEFTLQGILLAGCFSIPFKRRIIYVLFLGLLTGCVDEYIQLFADGRTSLVQDIFFDFSGTVLGTFIFGLSCRFRGR